MYVCMYVCVRARERECVMRVDGSRGEKMSPLQHPHHTPLTQHQVPVCLCVCVCVCVCVFAL